MNLLAIAKNTTKHPNNIYYTNTKSEISYPETGNNDCLQIEDKSFWFNHRNKVIVSAIKRFCKNSIFFDIGGGNGYVTKALQNEGLRAVLVEPGEQGCINAQSRSVKNIICSTLESAGFIPESLDSVGLFDVVEHIEKDTHFLRTINSYLKPQGKILITVPSYNILWSHEDNNAGHFRRYTLYQICRRLRSAGFKINYSTYIFSLLPIPIFLFRAIPYKLGLIKRSSNIQKIKSEHQVKESIGKKILQKIWDWELTKINQLKRIHFGGSCFVVGEKI